MSHFAVAVISDGTKTIEELLAPYQENNMEDCPKEFLEFNDIEEEYRAKYETEGCEYVIMPDGRRLLPWDEEFRVKGSIGFGPDTHKVPDHLEIRRIPFKETFPAFDDYMRDWCGEEKDPETGKYGYWENPNAKWDWYQVGGRWCGQVRATAGGVVKADQSPYEGGCYDLAKLRNLIWDRDEVAAKRAENEWRAWVDGEDIEGVGRSLWTPKYYIDQFGDREGYVLCASSMWWRAVITPDGKWHEVGEMGWFGTSSESNGEIVEWAKSFKERFIDPCDPDCVLTVVDCHI